MKESIKELTKKVIIIMVVSLILLACVIPPKAVYAIDSKTAGETIAKFAINFYEDYGDEVKYTCDGFSCRQKMYNGEKCEHGYYHCDCVGWVSFVVHQSLGLDTGGDEGGSSNFAQPKGEDGQQLSYPSGHFDTSYGGYDSKKSAEDIVSNAEPGDIILAWNHVLIYVGNGEVIHCAANLQREQLSQSSYADKLYGIARITDDAAAGINDNDCTTIFRMTTGAGELDDYGLYWGTTTGKYTGSYTLGNWLFSKLLEFFDYLLGIITYVIKIPFLGYTNIVEAVINDFLQALSGDDMTAVTHEEDKVQEGQEGQEQAGEEQEGQEQENQDQEQEEQVQEGENAAAAASGTNGTRVVLNNNEKLYRPTAKIETWDRVTIEDIIFNRIPVLDVDVFSFNKASEQEISENSIIYKIRANIATWYYIIRNVSIVVMLIVLVFLGIQLAITSSSEKKANYKGMLMSWLSGFVIIFVIHYYMILVITLNQEFIKIFEDVSFSEEIENVEDDEDLDEEEREEAKAKAKKGKTQSLYDTIRTRAYSLKISEGFAGTVIYMVLVYYLIKYLYIYFKRYLTVNILILIAPVIGAKYAYDRVKTGKGGGVTSWMFDFFVNVFLQSIHALIYTVFISIIISLAFDSLSGFVLALFTLNFMQKAEKIFIKIFNFEGKGSSLSDTRTDDLKSRIHNITSFAMFTVKAPKELWAGTMFVGKTAGRYIEHIPNTIGRMHHFGKNLGKPQEDKTEYKPFKFKNQLEKIKKAGEKIGNSVGDSINDKLFDGKNVRLSMHKYKESDPKLYKAMKGTLDVAKKQRKAQRSRMIKTGVNAVTGATRVMAGIPMFIVDEKAGALTLVTGIKALRSASSNEKKYGYQMKEEYKKGLDDTIDDAIGTALRATTPAGVLMLGVEKERSDKSRRRRRNIRRTALDASTLGFYSSITGEVKKFGKDSIDNKKTLEKLTALSQMAGKEDEIDKIMEEINKLEEELEREKLADKHDEEEKEKARKDAEKERKQRLQDTTSNASKEVIKGSTIEKVVEDYLFENDLTNVTDADIDSIMKRIIELENSSGAEIKFDSGFKNFDSGLKDNVRKSLQAKIDSKRGSAKAKRSFDKSDVVDIFENAIVAEGSVKEKADIESIADDYIQKNNLTKVKESDLNKMMNSIAKAHGAKDAKSAKFESGFKEKLEKTVKAKIKRKAEDDKKSAKVKEIEEKLSGRYSSLKKSVKEMHAITERAKVRTGSSVTNATSYVKRKNGKQIADKIRNSRKGGK